MRLPSSRQLAALLVTIRAKILLAFLAMSAITCGCGYYAVHGIRIAGDLVTETFDKSLMSINYARAAAADFTGMEAAFARRRTAGDPAQQQMLAARTLELAQTLNDDLSVATERAQSTQATRAARAVRHAVTDWQAAAQEEDWVALDQAADAVDAQIDLLVNYTAGDGFAYRQRAVRQIALERQINILATLAAVLVAGLVTSMLARRIMGPVADASIAAARIAWGQLDTQIPAGGNDELGSLLGAMALMRDNIRDMMNREITQRRSAQARLLDAIECSSEGVLLVDCDGLVVVANSQLASFFPAMAQMLQPGTPFATTMEAIARDCFATFSAPSLDAWLADRAPSANERQLVDGRWLRISRSATLDAGAVLIFGDITTIKQHEAQLERTNLWFSTALDNMSQGLVLFDAENRLRVANRRFAELHGLQPVLLAAGIHYRDIEALRATAEGTAQDGGDAAYRERLAVIEKREPRSLLQDMPGGRQLSILHEPMTDGGWVATYEDVTARRQAEARIAHMAMHDGLTGLPNRLQLVELIDQMLRGIGAPAMGFALLCLDLDQFKAVNDVLGHQLGDVLLCAVGERLKACVGEQDLVARLGGDEYAILLRGMTKPDEAVEVAAGILAALRTPFLIEDEPLSCGTSIGIVVAPGDGETSEALLKNADTALYRAKADGRGLYRFFEPEMDARQQARRTLELDLRHAVELGAFELFFQPLMEAKLERICGFESLLRWRHPTRGLVSPAEFVPMAEESGLIVPIGEWVLREACREAARWPEHVKVAVNVSPLQFKSPVLVEAVIEALAISGLPAHRLELEITESVLLADSEAVLSTLHRLHALGLRISMDDFGTGYSSLSYLRSFPFDKIKIDQSFIRDLGTEKDTRAIVRAIIGMGLSLGMRITAEGVEELAQLEILREEGCTEIQGYYYSRPKPAAEVAALIARWNGERRQGQGFALDPPKATRPLESMTFGRL